MNKLCIAIAICGLLAASAEMNAQPHSEKASPTVAPGLAYSPEKMGARLLEIADGPVPSRQTIEREFGLQFQSRRTDREGTLYVAAGQAPPFAVPHGAIPTNVRFTDAKSLVSISFQFEPTDWRRPYSIYCINPASIERELKERWKAGERKPGGHQPTHFFWTRTVASIERHLEISPEERGRSGSCLNSFYIRFEISPATTNQGENK